MLPIGFSIISGIDGVLVGLSLTYMLNISYLLQYLLNVSVETETCVSFSNIHCFIYIYISQQTRDIDPITDMYVDPVLVQC